MLIGLPCHFQHHVAHVVDLNRHQRQFFLDHLVMTNGLTKSDTLVGIAGGIFKGAFGKAGAARGVDQALHLKVVHHIEETHSFFAHHVALFNLHVVEIDFAGAEHMPADFMQRVNLNAGLTGVDPPQGEGFFGIFRLRIARQHQHIRVLFRTGNKGFLSVDVNLAVFTRVSGSGTVVV